VQFYSGFGLPEMRPWENGKTQIDGRSIEGVDRAVEFETEVFVRIESPGCLDQRLSEVGVDPPVALFVGIGQSAARDP
jgi:hypothetical protein